jgi:phage-related protein
MNFLESVFSFLGSYRSSIQELFFGLFDLINYVAHFLLQFILIVANYVVGIVKVIGSFFRHLWDDFFSNIFSRFFHAIRDLADWLESHLRPLIDWLQRAQRYILHLYTLYVRPILVMIQRIRQVLTILRALHIQWAQDLDNILAHVQSDINGVFLKITGTINAVIDVLNIVTDPTRFLRHPMLILSIRRSILALMRQLTGLPPGFWFPSPKHLHPLVQASYRLTSC